MNRLRSIRKNIRNRIEKGFEIKNQKGKAADIYVYGEIVNDKWYDSDVTPEDIRLALKDFTENGVKDVKMYINSPGGDVFAGIAIYSMMKRFNGYIDAEIDAMAASIATVVGMGADNLTMPTYADFFIHDPLVGICGYFNKNDFEDFEELLDNVKSKIMAIYGERVTASEDEISALMSKESSLSAKKALEMGFIDGISNEKNVKNIDKKAVKNDKEDTKSVIDINEMKKILNEIPLKETKKEEKAPEKEEKPEIIDYSYYENTLKLMETLY